MFYFITLFPAEIQLEIIYHAIVRSNSQRQWIDTKDSRSVSHVCSLWRDLALNTSAFWTTISVNKNAANLTAQFNHPSELSYEHALEVFPWTATLLHRSGSHPVNIDIDIQSPFFNPDWPEEKNTTSFSWTPAHSLALAEILHRHTSRFRTFRLVSEIWHPIEALTKLLAGTPMPLLESWDATRQNNRFGHLESTNIPPQSRSHVLEIASGTSPTVEHNVALYPRLTQLSFTGVSQSWRQLVPRHNLVVLILQFLPLDCRPSYLELRDLLLSSQHSLKQLKLWAAEPAPNDTVSDSDKIVLPNLDELALGVSVRENADFLARHLETPNLTRLEFGSHNGVIDGVTSIEVMEGLYLYILFTLPLDQLTHLTLRGMSFAPEILNQLEDTNTEQGELGFSDITHFLFYACSSLQTFRLIDPDRRTLHSLAAPSYKLDSILNAKTDPSAPPPCSVLHSLEIETNRIGPVVSFLQLNRSWSIWKSPLGISRMVDRMILDVPPQWGTQLRGLAGKNTAKELLNGRQGVWHIDGVGEVFNLMDYLVA